MENSTNYMSDYGIFNNILEGIPITIYTKDIKKENWNDYYMGLLNLFKDYIEQPNLQNTFITFVFDDGTDIELTTEDALINICMWGFIINADNKIMPYHTFFEEKGITNKAIKRYIDNFCIVPNRNKEDISSFMLNNIIYISLRSLNFVGDFGMYFNNSINIEDFIDMANACPEFDEIMHKDYSVYPADQMNSIAMKDTNRLIELILDSKRIMGREHCLIDAFRAQAGVKPKQFREYAVNIGVKPNGEGGIFPYSIDASYMNKGLNIIESTIAESAIGRQAQILSKKNTADSGTIARYMGLNCIDSKLYCKPGESEPDPNYDCHTRNFIKVYIANLTILEMFTDRYYRFEPNGIEYNVGCGDMINEYHPLIGKTVYFRSPITCASAAKGLGICKKCYGELFNTNKGINIGKIAAENFSSRLTQIMLSAKHLLEAKISNPDWNIDVENYLSIEEGIVSIDPNLNCSKKWVLIIEREDINVESLFSLNDDDDEEPDDEYPEVEREFINVFKIVDDEGESIEFHTQGYDNLYITNEFSNYIHNKGYNNSDDVITIPIHVLQADEVPMFEMGIYNDDMSNRLKNIVSTINLKAITESFTKDEFVNALVNKMIDCSINDVKALHAEILIMNQIRDKDDVLEMPDWDYPNNDNYQVLTLRRALETNPSIAVSMQFDNIAKTLYNPLSFKKKKPSQLDLFYHVNPQRYINQKVEEPVKKKSPFIKVKRV